jgi:hypothetical protein
MQYEPVLEQRKSQWYFEPKKDDPNGFRHQDRPVCPDCTTLDDRWTLTRTTREMIEETRAKGLPLSKAQKVWLGEIAELAAHIKMDADDRARLFGTE